MHVHSDLLLLWQANLDFCLESAGHSSWADQQKLLQVKDQMDTIGVCTLPHPADSRCASSRVDHWSTVHPRTACSGQCMMGRISVRLHAGWLMSDLILDSVMFNFCISCFNVYAIPMIYWSLSMDLLWQEMSSQF